MEKIITYSLLEQNINSNRYYVDAKILADETLIYGEKMLKQVIDDFMDFNKENNIETLRSREEYILEALIIGVLWNVYGNKAQQLTKINGKILINLVALRKKGKAIKVGADFIRGFYSTIFLNRKSNSAIDISILGLKRLKSWLLASGEFDEEVKRISSWERYFEIFQYGELANILRLLIHYGVWFESRSNGLVGKYTSNVQSFLKKQNNRYRFREDIIFTGRQRVEYHLNMVGAEILNRAFRNDFLSSRKKKLLVPVCMRYRPSNQCKAKNTRNGYICGHCIKECSVNKLSKMGDRLGFEVLIIPHGSSAFTDEKVKYGEVGIVGAACLLNLISGGLAARRLNLVPQCVILDYCGCRKHWDSKGIITDINVDELKNIMDELDTR